MSLKQKTNEPHVVDICLTSNPKLTAAFTSYQKVLNLFPMETLFSYTNNYNKHVHDPVTAEMQFYLNMNNQEDRAVKLTYIDNFRIHEDSFKQDSYWKQFYTTYEDVKTMYAEEPDYPWELPNEGRAEEGNLKGVLDKDVQFILYWVERFRCVHETVKQELYQHIPLDKDSTLYNNENVYFNRFNESMFFLRDHVFIKNRSTLQIVSRPEPQTYNRIQMNVVDPDTYDTATELNRSCANLFHDNIKSICRDRKSDAKDITWNVQDTTNNSQATCDTHLNSSTVYCSPNPSVSHGNNLVADSNHPTRIKSNLDELQVKMNDTLGDMKRVFDFLNKNAHDNKEEWGKYNYKYFMEGQWMEVDQYKVQLKTTGAFTPLSDRNNQILS